MIKFVPLFLVCLVAFVCSGCSPKWYVVVSGDASAIVDPSSGRRAVAVSVRIVSSARLDSLSNCLGDSLSLP